ncbi:hypothetical protein FH972_024728 [Carpinus fangiana]|uniref:Fe2OG dioxygenase domain-containing protein n=1 Tax=Carpinus fangiana TaxID=176857 RepID=A0A5N6KZA1_9ROSI|nr:hypothetical protein FH972_024728 [Carpinus fangiana]
MPVELECIDFGKFLHGEPDERVEVAEKIVKSFRDHGFAKFKNHGVSRGLVEGIWHWGERFFKMSPEQKMKLYHHPSPDPQRGWSKKGAETTSKLRKENAASAPEGELLDEKEHFDCGPPADSQFPNAWPASGDCDGFKEFVEDYFGVAQQTSLRIMQACEVGLHVPPGTLVQRCLPAASELRMLYYPPVSMDTLNKGLIKRAWPHTDFGIITLLFQDDLGGLELEDRSKPYTFDPVISKSDEMVVNISDTFGRWSNDYITPGVHQVNVPPKMRDQKDGIVPERYSSVFFFKAHRETSVGPLPPFVTAETPAKYPDISALEFHRQMTDILY